MESKNLVSMVLALTVGIICIGSVMVPVLTAAMATEETFTNEGYYRMSETSEETVIVWDPAEDPQKVTVNDVEVSLTNLAVFSASYSIAFAEDFILRYFYASPTNQSIQLWKSAYVNGTNISDGVTLTVTINDEGITWLTSAEGATASAYTHTGDYFVLDNDGAYIMKDRDTAAYIKEDSTIVYAAGISAHVPGSASSGFYFEGMVDDLTVTPMNTNVTVSDVAATYEAVDGYIGLSSLLKVTFKTSYTSGGTTSVADQTYSYFLVPYQVTAELSQHLSAAEIALIAVLPVMMIIAVLMIAVNRVRAD